MEAIGNGGEPDAAASAWDLEPHPWRRFAARVIDVGIFGTLAVSLAAIVAITIFPLLEIWLAAPGLASWFILDPLGWILAAPLSALAIATWRTTPGKLLFGIRVIAADGGRLTFAAALKRELVLLWWGIGVGIPLLAFAMAIRSYTELEGEGESKWDSGTGNAVAARAVEGWQRLGVIVGTALFLTIRIGGLLLQLTA
jgi:uncharacterized RDD family membrane protein YckC